MTLVTPIDYQIEAVRAAIGDLRRSPRLGRRDFVSLEAALRTLEWVAAYGLAAAPETTLALTGAPLAEVIA